MAAAEGEAQTREELQRLLDEERRKNEVYQRALNEMRNQMGVQQSQTEAEAESITNKLIARIQEIEKDKVDDTSRARTAELLASCGSVGSCSCPGDRGGGKAKGRGKSRGGR